MICHVSCIIEGWSDLMSFQRQAENELEVGCGGGFGVAEYFTVK